MSGYVLIGGGVASAAAASGLRAAGYDGPITLIADEPHAPYERPPLSKEYLSGSVDTADFAVNPATWYSDNGIDLRLGTRATSIDVDGRRVTLSDGEAVDYRALVLATGVRARTLPGFAGDRVHTIRTVADSRRLGDRIGPGTRLAILGAGFIGCEVAAIAATAGASVVVFDPNPVPLARVLGTRIGAVMIGVHSERGVDVRAGEGIREMTETPAGLRLVTDGGDVIEADELLVGVGSVPNTELAAAAGIDVDGGIVTDEFGRTGAPDVYAIGDVASRLHPSFGRRLRVEHHDTAMRHGANVALNLLGTAERFTEQPFFWSDQYDQKLQSVGRFDVDGEHVVRGSVDQRSFAAFSVTDGRITGMVALNRPGDVLQARKVLGVPHEVTAEQLVDEKFPLKRLLPRPARARRTEVPA